MKHVFDLDGLEHWVWLARQKDHHSIEIDEQSNPVELTDLGEGRYRLTLSGKSRDLWIAVDGDTTFVAIDGLTQAVRYRDNVAHFGEDLGGAGEDIARAPMPGSVVAVRVKEGQAVSTGDELIVIESMKLETTIRAWRDGVVDKVHVNPGQSFERESALLTLLPKEASAHA